MNVYVVHNITLQIILFQAQGTSNYATVLFQYSKQHHLEPYLKYPLNSLDRHKSIPQSALRCRCKSQKDLCAYE